MSSETIQAFSDPEASPAAPPAYFVSLTVENFRCFGPAQTLDLSNGDNRPAPWTIILGENGVGKTTLLQCLARLQPEAFPPKELELSGLDKDSDFLPFNFKPRDASIRAFRNYWTYHNKTKFGYAIRAGAVECSICYGHKISFRSAHQNVSNLSIEGFIGFTTTHIASENIAGLICYGYGASRRMGRTSLSEQRTEDTTASLFSDDVDLVNAEEWLLQADYAASKSQGNGKAASRRDQVKQVLIDLLPDVTDLRIDVPEGSLGAATVEFQTPYGWVPLKSLSLGYRTLITWMVDLASRLFDRYPDSPNPLAEPAVVLVDEIDLHLHPRWQRTLMQFLSDKFPNAQFIATAHSPLVVQAATDANIVLLRCEGDHVVIDNNVETIKNWRVDQILTSDLFGLESARPPQLDQALEERTQILSKPHLSKADERRLKTLEAQIGQLPTGETPEDMQAMDIIRRAAELLKTE